MTLTKPVILIGAIITAGIGGVIYFGTPTDEVSATKLQKKYDASTDIKAKYQLEGTVLKKTDIINAELDKHKDEPKDEIKITIGDKDKLEFEPTIAGRGAGGADNTQIQISDQ